VLNSAAVDQQFTRQTANSNWRTFSTRASSTLLGIGLLGVKEALMSPTDDAADAARRK